MTTKPRIAIFGAGSGGVNAYEYLKSEYELVAFADNDKKKHGQTLNGCPIVSAEVLNSLPIDKIVIASTYGLQIHRQLVYEENIPAANIIRLPISLLKKANPLYYAAFFTVAAFWLLVTAGALMAFLYWL